jgi:thiamine monophosphate synthase
MTNKKTEMGVVGLSTHTEEQVRVADEGFTNLEMGGSGRASRDAHLSDDEAVSKIGHPDGPDYIAIGPVFATGTKPDAEPVVGLEGVRRARALTMRPLVAIGGITRENARSVMEAGADSVAVIGGLFVEGISVREVVEDFLERLR